MNYLIVVLFGSFFGMCLIGVPIAFSLVLSSFFTAALIGMNPLVMIQQMYIMLDSYTLLAVPLFLMVGNVMDSGLITDRLVHFSRTLVGHIRGGLGHVNVVANMIMAGISGSATADAAALGSVMIPAMKKEGYPADVAAAINASAATMGPIIPPSIMMIVYGAYSNLSISALFLGGALPGILIGFSLMAFVYAWAVKNNFPKNEKRASIREIWHSFIGAILALLAPVLIVVGVVGGLFTATEAGMIVTVYCFIVTGLVYKTLNVRKLKTILGRTLEGMAQPLLCVAAAGSFGYMMAFLKVPSKVLDLVLPILSSSNDVLFFIVGLYIILGTFMDATPAIIIFMSIIQALSKAVGLNPYHVGDLIVITMCFGFITPPYGLTLLLSAGIADTSVTAVVRQLKWIYGVMLAVLVVLIFFPEVILFLPRLFLPATVGV
jgi:tripartite ATP-independent transporter DctM subunit